MSETAKRWSIPAKITTISACGVILSLGLCALSGGPAIEGGGNALGGGALIMFLGSVLGLIVGLISLVIQAFTGRNG